MYMRLLSILYLKDRLVRQQCKISARWGLKLCTRYHGRLYTMSIRAMDVFPAWSSSVDAVAAHHRVDLHEGLSDPQIEAQRKVHGFNELLKLPGKPMWKLVLEQFDDMLVKVAILDCNCSWMMRDDAKIYTLQNDI